MERFWHWLWWAAVARVSSFNFSSWLLPKLTKTCIFPPPQSQPQDTHRTQEMKGKFFVFCFLIKCMSVLFLNFYLFIYLFMAVLGLRFCVRAFSSCGKRGPLFIAVRWPLTIAASLVAEHRLQTRRLSSCGSRASLLHGMWDPPRPALEPVSPALAGRLPTTAPPGKPKGQVLTLHLNLC